MSQKVLIINPTPLRGKVISEAFKKCFPDKDFDFLSFSSPYSGSDILAKRDCIEMIRQAISDARKEHNADFYIYMRGRFEETPEGLEESALVLIQDHEGKESSSSAVSFQVPEKVAELVRMGTKFGPAVEQVYGIENVKEGNGFCGFLTKNIVTKSDQYLHAVIIALSSLILN